jgi:hypothetical protein
MSDQEIIIFGIPIPSSSPIFLTILAVHVAAGLTCTVSGIVAMLAPKRPGRRLRASGGPFQARGLGCRHVTGMAVSYILLLTGFYVDNGPNLPLWRSLPPVASGSGRASSGYRS